MTLRALFYAYILGGITFFPLCLAGLIFYTIYTSKPVETSSAKVRREERYNASTSDTEDATTSSTPLDTNDVPRTRKGWLTMRRTFRESAMDGGYVTLVRSFLEARSKDTKKSRPKDMWYAVLKGKVLYLYEDEQMTECEAAIELGSQDIVIYPEALMDAELFTRRNAICIRPKETGREGTLTKTDPKKQDRLNSEGRKNDIEKPGAPWYIFIRHTSEMEDWYLALLHASDHPAQTPTLAPLEPIFLPADMSHLVSTLDAQPDVIPTRWLNAIFGRIFFSFYRTQFLEELFIGRLMKKLSKVKRPTFLTEIAITEVAVGNRVPTFSKPMLKELTKEGDAAMEVHFHYQGEFRITLEATAMLSIGTFRSYAVKLVLAAVLKELEGNLLIKIKRPPSNRIWYGFTQTPKMALAVEPIVSDRQITWGMILSTIESKIKELIQDDLVLPHLDDIAFFDSSTYEHRGGIWQDAVRHERKADIPFSPKPHPTIEGQPSPVAVLPPAIEEPTPSMPFSEEPAMDGATSPTAHEEIGYGATVAAASLTATDRPLRSVLPSEPVLVEVSDKSSKSGNSSRRNSWFSSARSDDINIRPGFHPLDESLQGVEQHEQSEEGDRSSITSLTRSSTTSGAEDAHNSQTEGPTHKDEFVTDNATQLPQERVRRLSSRSVKEHGRSATVDSSVDSGDVMSAPAKSTSTFLSTLKSRAGDKQALSNTAKEAIRKWGVNWGNLKKEINGNDGDHGSIKGAIASRLRPEGSSSNTTGKTKSTYADLKAAVRERRGRDRDVHNPDEESENRSRSPIPVETRNRRSASHPRSEGAYSSVESSPASGLLSLSAPPLQGRRLSTSSTHSSKSNPAGSRVHEDIDEPDDVNTLEAQPAVVHVQPPKATMMTIPGIHASHRGKIMSMGYNAPPRAPEGKSAIQSVYRLWKPVAAGDQPSSSSHEPEPSSSTESFSATDKQDKDADPLNLSPPMTPPPRLVPPPLPPRSPPPPTISHSSASSPSSGLATLTASQTLKTIADKSDVYRRGSIERRDSTVTEFSNDSAPPLPPRRAQPQQT